MGFPKLVGKGTTVTLCCAGPCLRSMNNRTGWNL